MIPTHWLHWADWQIVNELDQLFVARWEEMFNSRTVDTWQPRSSSFRDLLLELASTAKTARQHDPYRQNIPHIVAEIHERAARDQVVQDAFPLAQHYLDQIKTATDLTTTESVALFAADHFSTYQDKVIAGLQSLVDAADAKPKDRFYSLALSLGTHAASRGYSLEYLRRQQSEVLTNPALGSFAKRFSVLVERLRSNPSNYAVYLPLDWSGPTSPHRFNDCSFDFVQADDARLSSAAGRALVAQYKSAHFIRIDLEALDPHAAIEAARQKFADLTAFLRLFKVQSGSTIRGDTALVEPAGAVAELTEYTRQRQSTIRDSSQAETLLPQVMSMHSKLSAEDAGQILSALHYHELALSSATEPAALMNLWIALEALTRGGEGSTTVERVCNYVAPSVAIDNAVKTLTGLSADIRSVWYTKRRERTEYLSKLKRSTSTRLAPADLLDTFRDVTDGPLITPLYAIVSDHVLMRYRIHRYRTKVFAETKSVAQLLTNNYKNVEWQLRRIYRFRNDIVHRGRTLLAGRHLVNHLHSYFIRFVNNLLATLVHHEEWGIRRSIDHQRQLYALFVNRLRSGPACSRESIIRPYLLERDEAGMTPW